MSKISDEKLKIFVPAIVTIIVALIALLPKCTKSSEVEPMLTATVIGSFIYQVQVQDQDTGEPIHRAMVTIMLGGDFAPVDDVTDVNGVAMVPIDESRAGKLGQVVVTASGYSRYDKKINLNQGDLPDIIQLVSSP